MKENKLKSAVLNIIRHPVFSLVGVLIGIIGLLLAINSLRLRKLSFSIYPVRASIVKSGPISTLEVYHNKELIKTDVSIIQLAIWNAGKHEIVLSDILDPIAIITKPRTPILEATIQRQSRKLINLSVDMSAAKEGTLPISWRILEKDDGGVIQIVYAGDTSVSFQLSGIVQGQGKPIIRKALFPSKDRIPLGVVLILFLGMLLNIFATPWIRPINSKAKIPLHIKLFFIFAFAFLILGLISVYLTARYVPPFGFK